MVVENCRKSARRRGKKKASSDRNQVKGDGATDQRTFGKLPSDTPGPPSHPQDIGGERVPQDFEAESWTPGEPDQAEVEGGGTFDEGPICTLLLILVAT